MNLETTYMGLKLRNPIVVSSSELTNSVPKVQRLEQHGAGAVVLKSLFEEQILADMHQLESNDGTSTWSPEVVDYVHGMTRGEGVAGYLNLIGGAKRNTKIPVIASIGCVSGKYWIEFAERIQGAGADGLELNIAPALISTSDGGSKSNQEPPYVDLVRSVLDVVSIPIAVKLGVYHSNLADFITLLSRTGVRGIVMFNRFYRPDVDIDTLRLVTDKIHSAPEEITMPLRWISLLSDRVECDLAAATGIHTGSGIVKQILAGATITQVCSTLYLNGIGHLETMLTDLERWMETHNFETLDAFRGLLRKDPETKAAFERVHFMRRNAGEFTGAGVQN